jgi:hypothetical protein
MIFLAVLVAAFSSAIISLVVNGLLESTGLTLDQRNGLIPISIIVPFVLILLVLGMVIIRWNDWRLRHDLSHDPMSAAQQGDQLRWGLALAVLCAAILSLFPFLPDLMRALPSPFDALLLIMVFIVFMVGLIGIGLKFRVRSSSRDQHLINWSQAIHTDDMATAEQIANTLSSSLPRIHAHTINAITALYRRQFAHAESHLTSALTLIRVAKTDYLLHRQWTENIYLIQLELFYFQKRDDEAATLVKHLALFPIHEPTLYLAMAHFYLQMGQLDQVSSYLQLAQQAFLRNSQPLSYYYYGLQAWHAALIGAPSRVQPLLDTALALIPVTHRLKQAEFYLISAQVHRVNRDLPTAQAALEQAYAFNPAGPYGELARQALR